MPRRLRSRVSPLSGDRARASCIRRNVPASLRTASSPSLLVIAGNLLGPARADPPAPMDGVIMISSTSDARARGTARTSLELDAAAPTSSRPSCCWTIELPNPAPAPGPDRPDDIGACDMLREIWCHCCGGERGRAAVCELERSRAELSAEDEANAGEGRGSEVSMRRRERGGTRGCVADMESGGAEEDAPENDAGGGARAGSDMAG